VDLGGCDIPTEQEKRRKRQTSRAWKDNILCIWGEGCLMVFHGKMCRSRKGLRKGILVFQEGPEFVPFILYPWCLPYPSNSRWLLAE
jgi:hypothetical protein